MDQFLQYLPEAALLMLLAAAAYQDLRQEALHIALLLGGGAAGVGIRLLAGSFDVRDMAAGALTGVCVLLLGYAAKGAIGAGDGLLLMVTGIFLGWRRNCMLLFCALILAALLSIGFLILGKKKKDDRIPFAPFVLAGFVFLQCF